MGVAPEALLSAYQVHSPDVIVATRPFAAPRPKADAIVTDRPGLALGASSADCGPVLFADPQARVIGAAHAGWKGALTGVLENTVAAMERLGADRARMVAVLGPSIGPRNYEVGPEFVERFIDGRRGQRGLFHTRRKAWPRTVRSQPLYGRRLRKAGVTAEALNRCTYAEEDLFYLLSPHDAPRGGRLRPADIRDRIGDPVMALHFERSEFDARRDRLVIEMAEKKLDALLLFAQESMYWLTGYDTFGFCFFQCLVVKADGSMVLLTRSADLRQARHTSTIDKSSCGSTVKRPIRRSTCAISSTISACSARASAWNTTRMA